MAKPPHPRAAPLGTSPSHPPKKPLDTNLKPTYKTKTSPDWLALARSAVNGGQPVCLPTQERPVPPVAISKSRNHKIISNPNAQHPYRLLWDVPRRGQTLGMPVTMHRDSDIEGAREFAQRWGIKMPAGTK